MPDSQRRLKRVSRINLQGVKLKQIEDVNGGRAAKYTLVGLFDDQVHYNYAKCCEWHGCRSWNVMEDLNEMKVFLYNLLNELHKNRLILIQNVKQKLSFCICSQWYSIWWQVPKIDYTNPRL